MKKFFTSFQGSVNPIQTLFQRPFAKCWINSLHSLLLLIKSANSRVLSSISLTKLLAVAIGRIWIHWSMESWVGDHEFRVQLRGALVISLVYTQFFLWRVLVSGSSSREHKMVSRQLSACNWRFRVYYFRSNVWKYRSFDVTVSIRPSYTRLWSVVE